MHYSTTTTTTTLYSNYSRPVPVCVCVSVTLFVVVAVPWLGSGNRAGYVPETERVMGAGVTPKFIVRIITSLCLNSADHERGEREGEPHQQEELSHKIGIPSQCAGGCGRSTHSG